MKALHSILVVFLVASCAIAHALSAPSTEPDVTVLQMKWRMDVRNAKLNEDQFEVEKEREREERQRRDLEIQNEKLKAQGMPTKLPPVHKPTTRPSGITVTYIYEVKFKNTGEKEVRRLSWDYVFSDPDTKQEVGRQRFEGEVRIGLGKTKNVVMRSASPPTGTIDAAKAGKKSQNLYSEQVIIQKIGYADGSIWQAPPN
jgi:hypothetical protein